MADNVKDFRPFDNTGLGVVTSNENSSDLFADDIESVIQPHRRSAGRRGGSECQDGKIKRNTDYWDIQQ